MKILIVTYVDISNLFSVTLPNIVCYQWLLIQYWKNLKIFCLEYVIFRETIKKKLCVPILEF